MKKYKIASLLLLLLALMQTTQTFAQGIGINNNGGLPDGSSMLDVVSTSKGILIPRMNTTEQLNIVSPATGLLIFNTDSVNFWFFDGSLWRAICNCDIISVPPNICPDSIVDSRDGEVYKTIKLGIQCWMQENLNVGSMINGTSNQTNNSIIEKYCYQNNIVYCTYDGALYQWDEMMQYITVQGVQGICPTGWHVPTDGEYNILEEYLGICTGTAMYCTDYEGPQGTNAQAMGDRFKKEIPAPNNICSTGNTLNPPCGASGFDAILAGGRWPAGTFNGRGATSMSSTSFWTSTEYPSNTANAWRRFLAKTNQYLYRDGNTYSKDYGFSVRCIKD